MKLFMKLNVRRLPVLLAVIIIACSSFPAMSADNTPVLFRDKMYDEVVIAKDIVYREYFVLPDKKETLSLDYYSARDNADGSRPAVLLIHGGGFQPGNDKRQSYIGFLARDFAKRGFAVFSIDYRLRPIPSEDFEGAVSDAVYDSAAALKWIISHAVTYRINEKNIFVAGGSSGGVISVNLCYGNSRQDTIPCTSHVLAVINLWGSPGPHLISNYIGKGNPPMLIVHGMKDNQIPYSNSEFLCKALNDNGTHAELYPVKDGKHLPMSQMQEVADKASSFMYRILKENNTN